MTGQNEPTRVCFNLPVMRPVTFKDNIMCKYRPMWYILVDKIPTPVTAEEYHKWWSSNPDEKIVAKTYMGNIEISTVFLGLDHAYQGPPLLFETMIFGGEQDEYQERYHTYDEAYNAHHELCTQIGTKELVRQSLLNISN